MMLSTNYSSKQGIRRNPDHHPKASLHVAPGHSFLCSGKAAVDVGSRKDVRQQPSKMTISANSLPEHGTSSKPQQAPENVFARNTMVQCPTLRALLLTWSEVRPYDVSQPGKPRRCTLHRWLNKCLQRKENWFSLNQLHMNLFLLDMTYHLGTFPSVSHPRPIA